MSGPELTIGPRQSAFDRERHWQNLFSYANFFGYAGAEMRAVSALDIALWDLLGQHLGQPIFNAIQTGFKTQFVAAGVLAILLALVVDLLLVAVERVLTPWTRRLRTT